MKMDLAHSASLLGSIKDRVRLAQTTAMLSADRRMLEMYWATGGAPIGRRRLRRRSATSGGTIGRHREKYLHITASHPVLRFSLIQGPEAEFSRIDCTVSKEVESPCSSNSG